MGFDKKYVDDKVKGIENYLDKELDVLLVVQDYETSSKLLKQLPERISLVVRGDFHLPLTKDMPVYGEKLYDILRTLKVCPSGKSPSASAVSDDEIQTKIVL